LGIYVEDRLVDVEEVLDGGFGLEDETSDEWVVALVWLPEWSEWPEEEGSLD